MSPAPSTFDPTAHDAREMSTALDIPTAVDPLAEEQYRALSLLAVVSFGCGLLSALVLISVWLSLIAVLGVLVGLYAGYQVRRQPDELTGGGLARAGLILSLVMLIVGWARAGYVYATEVPEGYQRVSYAQLQPDNRRPGEIVPQSALALDGQRVFIKGYVYPGEQSRGIKRFVLCRDNGACCFGGQPKLTDMIQVDLEEPLTLDYSPFLKRLGGIFYVDRTEASDDLGGVLYRLEADYLR